MLSVLVKGIYELCMGDVYLYVLFIIGDNFNDDIFGVFFFGVYLKKILCVDIYFVSGFFDEEEGWGVDSVGVLVDMNGNGEIDG